MSEDGGTVDARFLHEGETIEVKSEIEFPCHMATTDCILAPDRQLVASMPQRVLNCNNPNFWEIEINGFIKIPNF
jgi:hypothetical protein